jgi:hypothetical protein
MNVGGAGGYTRSKGRRRRLAAAATSSSIPFSDRQMIAEKSPGAVAARGASEDELCPHVVSEISVPETLAQAPIFAILLGSDRCTADGISVRAYAPVLALCRALIDAGYDPGRALLGHRGGNLALAVRSIGEGALLTVEDDRHGRPRLRRWRVRGRCGDDPPASKLGTEDGASPRKQKAAQSCATTSFRDGEVSRGQDKPTHLDR